MRSPDGPTLFVLVPFARHMRKHPTRSEAIFWRAVCRKQLGVRVRRQHPACPYVLDFFVASRRLAIELDGGVHRSADARRRDAVRDAELLRCYGIRVLRIDAGLVERDVEAALAIVRTALAIAL